MTFFLSELFTVISIVMLSVLVLAGTLATQSLWHRSPYLAPAFGVVAAALVAWAVAIAFFLGPPFGIVASWLLFLACAVSLRWFPWRRLGKLVFAAVGSVTALAAGLIAFGFLWGSRGDALGTIQTRFFGMPPDNAIPNMFAAKLFDKLNGIYLLGDWHASDRPPLQTGFILFERSLLGSVVASTNPPMLAALAVGIGLAVQLLWIPALYSCLRALRLSTTGCLVGIAGAAAMPVVFLHSLYSWPKLLSAALMIAAVSICVQMILDRELSAAKFSIGGAAASLSLLAHGAAAFALPIFAGLAVVLLVRTRDRHEPASRRIVTVIWGVLTSVCLYLPWVAYQKFVDPPGDRLLKWHLAGMIPPNEQVSFFQALSTQYSALTPAQWASNRLQNLDAVSGASTLVQALSTKSLSVETLKALDFYSLLPSLIIPLLLCLLIVVIAIARRTDSPKLVQAAKVMRLGVLGLCALSIGLWIVLMFLPYSTLIHQGTHFWPLLGAGLAFSLGYEIVPKTTIGLVLVQAAYGVYLYGNLPGNTPGTLLPAAVGVAVISFGALPFVAQILRQSLTARARERLL
jgi:hypothetical protein